VTRTVRSNDRSKRLPIVALVAANAVSQLGNVVAVVALPWFVLVTTGSPLRMGLTAFAGTLPIAIGAIVGGPLVDRIGARPASIAADLGAGAGIAGIPLLHALGVLEFWHILLLAFVSGAFEAPGRAARRAMLPDLAERAAMPLERGNSISTTSEHLGYVLGAPLAGVLIVSLGAPAALWIDAASFVVSAVLVAGAVPSLRAAVGTTRWADGIRFVLGQPLLRTFFAIWTAGAFLIGPLASVLLPVYAREELGGAGSFPACVTAYGVGGLVGTLLFGLVGLRTGRRAFYVGMWVSYPLLSVTLVALPPLPLAVAILFGIGFVVGAYDPFEVTVHQELTPPELRARTFAVLIAAEMAVVPPAMLLSGALVGALGLRAVVILFAVGNVLLAAFALLNQPARQL
jgi:MFS family permease